MEQNDEVLEKEINQLDSVDESVEETFKDMASLYKKITKKLKEDGICFISKEKLKEPFDIIAVPNKKVDRGMVAFIAVNKTENK